MNREERREYMGELIQQLKILIVSVWAIIMSALAPTVNALFLLVIFALVNGFLGYQSNYIVYGERFKLSKFWRALTQVGFYMLLVVLLHLAFHIFGDQEKSLMAIRIICWIAVWGYTVKILQNFLLINPNTKGVRLLYEVLAVKFLPRILKSIGFDVEEKDIKSVLEEVDELKEAKEKELALEQERHRVRYKRGQYKGGSKRRDRRSKTTKNEQPKSVVPPVPPVPPMPPTPPTDMVKEAKRKFDPNEGTGNESIELPPPGAGTKITDTKPKREEVEQPKPEQPGNRLVDSVKKKSDTAKAPRRRRRKEVGNVQE